MFLETICYTLTAVLFMIYTITDGFDLGVGMIYNSFKSEKEKITSLYSIWPVWNGNEDWLLGSIGILFVAFPLVYTTLLSSMYIFVFIFLTAIVIRAAAIEFREKLKNKFAIKICDYSLGIGSLVPSFLFGFIGGNVIKGIPLNEKFNYIGNTFDLFTLFPVITGFISIMFFMMYGALYLSIKTSGDQLNVIKKKIPLYFTAFIILLSAGIFYAVLFIPASVNNFAAKPLVWVFSIILTISLVLIFVMLILKKDKFLFTFILGAITGISIIGIIASGLFPSLIISSNDSLKCLTIYNSASGHKTLVILMIIASIGIPLILFYNILIYSIFKGKTSIDNKNE